MKRGGSFTRMQDSHIEQIADLIRNDRVDAAANGLISPDELWSRIKSYGPALKAQAMADYLLIQRSLLEMQRGPA
jgi:hypothetical protein